MYKTPRVNPASLKCPRLGHSTYNPAKHGPQGIKAGCITCQALWEIYTLHRRLVTLIEDTKERIANAQQALHTRATPSQP